MNMLPSIAARLGAQFIDVTDAVGWPPGVAEFDFGDICYPVPAVVLREDAQSFEVQLRELLEHELEFRRKWLP